MGETNISKAFSVIALGIYVLSSLVGMFFLVVAAYYLGKYFTDANNVARNEYMVGVVLAVTFIVPSSLMSVFGAWLLKGKIHPLLHNLSKWWAISSVVCVGGYFLLVVAGVI